MPPLQSEAEGRALEMVVTVGRIRNDPRMSVKYFVTGSNTIRGAAGSNLLGAELARAEGYL